MTTDEVVALYKEAIKFFEQQLLDTSYLINHNRGASEMKYKYLVISFYDNDVKGTNSFDVANEFSESEEHLVIGTETAQKIYENTKYDIEELES